MACFFAGEFWYLAAVSSVSPSSRLTTVENVELHHNWPNQRIWITELVLKDGVKEQNIRAILVRENFLKTKTQNWDVWSHATMEFYSVEFNSAGHNLNDGTVDELW